MKHLGTQNIVSERLYLTKFKKRYYKDAFNNWMSSSVVTKYLTWNAHKNKKESKNVIKKWIKSYKNKNFYHWAIVLKETKKPIGSISVVEIDETCDTVICGYCIGEKWWGKGYVPEAYSSVINFLFNNVKAKKIIGRHDVENENSGKVMLKCGLKYVKILKGAGSNVTNAKCDLKIYEIINENM